MYDIARILNVDDWRNTLKKISLCIDVSVGYVIKILEKPIQVLFKTQDSLPPLSLEAWK